MTSEEQLKIYGKVLTGSETESVTAAMGRIQYLKLKMRRLLELENIGDPQDVAADVNKSLLLGVGILSGIITNTTIIARYKKYVTDQVQLYGGPAAIMDKLEANAVPLAKWFAKLTTAKAEIIAAAAVDIEVVAKVDIEVAAVKEGEVVITK